MTAATALSQDQLRDILSRSLSPDAAARQHAENALLASQTAPGHCITVLRLVASNEAADGPVRQAAAVHFKNMVKKGWAPNSGGPHGDDHDADAEFRKHAVPAQDRDVMKNHLVELMCTVPPQIQVQLGESISLIAASDFPSQWDNLLPDLISRLDNRDWSVVNGVLVTANSIFKRFRYVQRSDALYKDILYVLHRFQEPLTELFKAINAQLDAFTAGNNVAELRPRLAALRTICRIFYSLNYQDLPEYFEDHMEEWMAGFAKHLEYVNPHLEDNDEENEPGPIDVLQVAVIQNLYLYANKDEEPFLPYLAKFTTLVWNLLLRVSQLPKHDALATTGIRFLSSLVGKLMHRELFQEEATLREIFARIVIPNLMIREVDEERFEDNPQEFILSDMEGSDTESRRKCAQELLRAMCRQFEPQTTQICSEHVSQMLASFHADAANQWRNKDVAIHLMLGISIKTESAQYGVSQVNEGINVMEFFSSHVLTELQEPNMTVRPMVKATSIKFVSIFRNQFTKQHLEALLPLLIAHLGSPDVVVHTYAAAAMEKILTCKVDSGTQGGTISKVPKIGRAELNPVLNQLFTGLFSIVDNVDLDENEYVMKCIMRASNVARDDLLQVVQVVLEKLTAALARVAKNPKNPQYNHYLFESIAVLIRSVCTIDAAHTTAFENFLFPPFQDVLQKEVAEFTPYVFQLLAQILEFRPEGTGLGAAYTALFPPLLSPTLWECKGNIPALTRLLIAYLSKGASEILVQQPNSLLGILGVFQKLISSQANEQYAFDLLRAIVMYVPQEAFMPRFKDVLQIILTKMQKKKTEKLVGLISHFFALFVGKFGPQAYFEQLNLLQNGLGLNILAHVWIPRLLFAPPTRLEAKTQIVGLTKLLCETPVLLADANAENIWSQIVCCAVKIVASPDSHLDSLSADGDDDDVEIGYDATYSVLHFAARPARDPFPDVPDASIMLAQSLHRLCASHPGRFTPLIQKGFESDPKLGAGLESLCLRAGVSLS
mmetsp:Transcript_22644/g.47061  ORF Transcript_22644/g.47061 Transcript_22644/m.47061 type:complete len:1004 (+) Transcript_22644:128-3139(+)